MTLCTRLAGTEMNRDTVGNVLKAGFRITRVRATGETPVPPCVLQRRRRQKPTRYAPTHDGRRIMMGEMFGGMFMGMMGMMSILGSFLMMLMGPMMGMIGSMLEWMRVP
jgi:hypothetical protein